MNPLSADDLAHYDRHGYAYLRGAIPAELLAEGRRIIEPWVNFQIQEWRDQGKIDRDFREEDFWHRLLAAWRAAGRPMFRRRPNRFLVNPKMYAFFRHRTLLDIAEQVIGTPELSVHGIFNARPQLLGAAWTDTPWHQDGQYWILDYGEPEPDTERRTHVMSMWIPLQSVDALSGGLHLMSKADTKNHLFDHHDYDYEQTGFFGMGTKDIARFPKTSEPMAPGDALIFNQRTPHGAEPNQAERIRWSIDIRYEATARATVVGRRFGFVAQSADKSVETTYEAWARRCCQ